MIEEKETEVSGREIRKEFEKGHAHFKEVVVGFCKDVETLVRSAQNLYEEERIILALAGVKLKVTITSDIDEQPLIDCEIGARIGQALQEGMQPLPEQMVRAVGKSIG